MNQSYRLPCSPEPVRHRDQNERIVPPPMFPEIMVAKESWQRITRQIFACSAYLRTSWRGKGQLHQMMQAIFARNVSRETTSLETGRPGCLQTCMALHRKACATAIFPASSKGPLVASTDVNLPGSAKRTHSLTSILSWACRGKQAGRENASAAAAWSLRPHTRKQSASTTGAFVVEGLALPAYLFGLDSALPPAPSNPARKLGHMRKARQAKYSPVSALSGGNLAWASSGVSRVFSLAMARILPAAFWAHSAEEWRG